jgi:branched-chain amino acid transport system substrate-binding protein
MMRTTGVLMAWTIVATATFGMASVRTLAAEASDQEFRIGWVLPLTGPVAELAKSYSDGAEVAIAMVNASGGIGGFPARLIMCDSQSQEQQAVICTKKLINEDQVNLMLGATGTPPTLAIIPTIESVGMPLFAIAAGRTTWVPLKKWVFKAIQANDDQLEIQMQFAKKKGWNRAALIRDNGSLGRDISDAAHNYAQKNGIEIVADETMAFTDTDVTAQVTRIRAIKPDVVLVQGPAMPSNVLISKKLVQLGVTAPLIISANAQLEAYVRLVPEAVEQSYWPGSKVTVKNLPESDPLYGPISAFAAQYKKMRNGASPSGNTATVADDILVTQVAGRSLGAKVLDKNALREGLESLDKVAGLQGFWTFSATDHGTSFADGLVMVKYSAGEWVPQQ